jgi:glycosyltransferase involved in cell wall biosynthesis
MNIVQRTMSEIIRLNLARQKNIGNITDNPLVSIRIPTLNRSLLLLERAIPSALGQTYRNVEVVIVGDHCTDNTEKVLKGIKSNRSVYWHNLEERNEYEKKLLKDPETRWFMGPVRATNKATELCSGDWIAHLDDDDFWTQSHIQDLLEFAQKGDYEMVYGDYIERRYGEEKKVENGPSTWLMRKYIADVFKLDPDCWKKKWDKVSDIDVFERMKSAEVRIGHLEQIVAYVLPRPGEDTVGLDAYKKYDPFHSIS